jgi:uncharacterized protein (DUF2141 family)
VDIIIRSRWLRLSLWSLAASFMVSPVLAEQSSSLTVNITGLQSQQGEVLICLWKQDDENFPLCSDDASFRNMTIAPTDSSVTVVFEGIPAGDYALSAFHDEDRDGRIDRGFMGRPTEGLAVSNAVEGERGRPSFNKTKFTMNGAETISMPIMYFSR